MAKKGKQRCRRFTEISGVDADAAAAAKHESQQAFIAQFDALYPREMSGAEALALCHQAVEAKVFDCFNGITAMVKKEFGGRLAELSQRLQNPETTNPGQLMTVLQKQVDALRQSPVPARKSAHGRKGAPAAARA